MGPGTNFISKNWWERICTERIICGIGMDDEDEDLIRAHLLDGANDTTKLM